jgi:hypothetical protein
MPGHITRSVRLLAAPLLLAGVAGGVAPGAASAAQAGTTGTAAPFSISGILSGVAATSASDAWSVGYSGSLSTKPLIVRWNGAAGSSGKTRSIVRAGDRQASAASLTGERFGRCCCHSWTVESSA